MWWLTGSGEFLHLGFRPTFVERGEGNPSVLRRDVELTSTFFFTFRTIIDFPKVLYLDGGRVIEFGEPLLVLKLEDFGIGKVGS